ncbi:hypothetical protein MSG28_012666, partial [Choristoneura fumiferana]
KDVLENQYPWTALVEYKKRNQTALKCSAVLISGRYALSGAQCISGNTERIGVPINIRLGDYDVTNDGPDCVDDGDGKSCNTGALTIPIEKIIKHPKYQESNRRSREHDIALIKLKETAPYTDFIRPICLPTSDVTNAPRSFVLAGWGSVNNTGSLSNILHHVNLPLIDADTCKSAIKNARFPELGSGQLCAGGEGKDSCAGDSGAPLMYQHDVFELAGIVSFGFQPCGTIGKPGVYTKVFAYMDWIRENIVE